MPNHIHLNTPPPLPLPLPAVPRGSPLPLGMPRALPATAVPRVREGAGVEYFEEALEDWGGCSTNDVSFVLFIQISKCTASSHIQDLHESYITVTI